MHGLKCNVCSKQDIICTESGIYQCINCGCMYSLDQVKQLLKDSLDTSNTNNIDKLIKKAETQIEYEQEADYTIATIIHEFPQDYRGYYLYIKNEFRIVISFWEDGFKRIYNGLVSGEISGLYRWHSTPDNFNVHPLMLKAYNEGVNNAQILHNNGIFVRRLIHTSSPNGFQNFEISVYGETIEYFLGREIVFDIPYDNRYDILLEESYYKNIVIQNGDISNIKKLAINNANTHVTQFNRCPKCEGELSKPLFSKRLKCQRCNLSF